MLLRDLIKNIKIKNVIGNIDNITIDNITIDSNEKKENSLFIAQKGLNFDGHDFIQKALANGATAVIVEHAIPQYKFEKILNSKDLQKGLLNESLKSIDGNTLNKNVRNQNALNISDRNTNKSKNNRNTSNINESKNINRNNINKSDIDTNKNKSDINVENTINPKKNAFKREFNSTFPQIIVEDSRSACAEIASTFYGNPKDRLTFAGITGTNGKTSVSFFLAELLKQANKKTAVIGSLGVFYDNKHFTTDLTTPDPILLHKIFAQLANNGIEYVVMEVSAHALALKKVENIKFKVGILTNITQDHLDFFNTMEVYATEKLNWFHSKNMEFGVINADDKLSKKLRESKNGLCTLYYGLHSPSDTFATNIKKFANKTEFAINLLDNIFPCNVNLSGEFNIYNTLSAATAALCLGVSLSDVKKGLSKIKAPIGRFNVLDLGENKTVIVDFAHTPDSLEKVLKTAREICKGNLISVFGCGGDRDKLKRPLMGEISEDIADFTILTSDNPRFENPNEILKDIENGFKGKRYKKITNRKSAIAQTLSKMKKNDVVVIAGKGGELYQDICGIKTPYSDFDEIEKFKRKLNKNHEISHITL